MFWLLNDQNDEAGVKDVNPAGSACLDQQPYNQSAPGDDDDMSQDANQ